MQYHPRRSLRCPNNQAARPLLSTFTAIRIENHLLIAKKVAQAPRLVPSASQCNAILAAYLLMRFAHIVWDDIDHL